MEKGNCKEAIRFRSHGFLR